MFQWQSRRSAWDHGPKTITQIRQEAANVRRNGFLVNEASFILTIIKNYKIVFFSPNHVHNVLCIGNTICLKNGPIYLQETGVYIPQQSRGGGGQRPPMAVNGSLGAPWKPGLPPQNNTGAFGDFFGSGMMGTVENCVVFAC